MLFFGVREWRSVLNMSVFELFTWNHAKGESALGLVSWTLKQTKLWAASPNRSHLCSFISKGKQDYLSWNFIGATL